MLANTFGIKFSRQAACEWAQYPYPAACTKLVHACMLCHACLGAGGLPTGMQDHSVVLQMSAKLRLQSSSLAAA